MKNKKNAFTLAEVLITLGIISIVASMTIPNLIHSYKKVETETRIARFYSVINNAIALSEIDNGKVETWEILPANVERRKEWFDKYIFPYLKYKKFELKRYENANDGTLIYFYDGSYLAVWDHVVDWHYYVRNTKNWQDGVSYFLFQFDPYNNWGSGTSYAHNKPVVPYKFGWDGTRESLINGCKNGGKYCAALIQENGWKIPDDYPVKF